VDPTTQPESYHRFKWPVSTQPIRGNFSKPRSSLLLQSPQHKTYSETKCACILTNTTNIEPCSSNHEKLCPLHTILHFKLLHASKSFPQVRCFPFVTPSRGGLKHTGRTSSDSYGKFMVSKCFSNFSIP